MQLRSQALTIFKSKMVDAALAILDWNSRGVPGTSVTLRITF